MSSYFTSVSISNLSIVIHTCQQASFVHSLLSAVVDQFTTDNFFYKFYSFFFFNLSAFIRSDIKVQQKKKKNL